jgi:nucleoside-diphosphate-sugar epimerase
MTAVVLIGASGWFGRRLRDRLPGCTVVAADDILRTEGAALPPLLGDRDTVIVNAAGARHGTEEVMQRLNVDLPTLLGDAVARDGGHVVHLGSAAEYGLDQPDGVCHESADALPGSDYGRTKLAGTQRLLGGGLATVLRVFNVAADPPQEGSPLADVVARIAAAIARGADVEVVSAGTVRDWVSADFVCASVVHAAEVRPAGVYNLCSGAGVRMGDAVEEALNAIGVAVGVRDLAMAPATVVIGTPDRWRSTSGLAEAFGLTELAGVLARAARGPAGGGAR